MRTTTTTTTTRPTLIAMLIGAALLQSGAAYAASPDYVGLDLGLRNTFDASCANGADCTHRARRSGRLYAGYGLGRGELFGKTNTSNIEVLAYSTSHANGAYRASNGALRQGSAKIGGVGVTHANAIAITDQFSIHARLGLAYSRTKVSMPGTANDSASRVGLAGGLGMSHAVNSNWSVHADWNYIPVSLGRSGKTEMDQYSLGARYTF